MCSICTATTMQQIDVELNKDRLAFTDDDDDEEEWSSYPAALKALTLSCLYFSSWMPTLPRQDMAETQKT